MPSQTRQSSEINTVDIIEKTSALTLETFRQILDRIDGIALGQTGAYLASIGSVAAVELLKGIREDTARIREDIGRIEARLDAMEGGGRTPGTTDRLELTETEQRLLRRRLGKKDVTDAQIVNAMETFKREMRAEMQMYAPLSTHLWNWIKSAFGKAK